MMDNVKLDLMKAYFAGGNAQGKSGIGIKEHLQAIIEVVDEENKKKQEEE